MGIVLYRLTTGLHPFLGESDIVTMKNIISRPVLPPRMKNPSFPAELERVLLTCLKKDANERYQTMLELDAAIERVLAIAGASVVDDDIGAFVRSVMGDRGQKRRGALRDAVRAADERAAGIAATPHSGSSPIMPHEGVTDIALTGINTAVTSVPTNLSSMAPGSMIPPSPEGYEGTGVGHGMAGSMLPTDPYAIPRERGRTGMILALSAVGVLALGGTILAFHNSTPAPIAKPADATPSATPAAPTTAAPVATPTPAETASAAPVADQAASAGSTGSLNVNDLPPADANTKTDPTTAKTSTQTNTQKTASTTKTTTTGTATSPVTTTTTTTKKNWVPGVQDPGF
jgi:serine/threonine-protein kinase